MLGVLPNILKHNENKKKQTGLNNDHDHGVRTLGCYDNLYIFDIGYGVVSKRHSPILPENYYGTYELHSNHKDRLQSESPAAMYEQVLERGP